MLEMLTAITEGKGQEGDIEKLEKLAKSIKAGALCALGQTAPNPILSTLRYFRDEYEAHIKENRCPAEHAPLLSATRSPMAVKAADPAKNSAQWMPFPESPRECIQSTRTNASNAAPV